MILPPFESSFYCLGQSILDIWKKQLSNLAITSFLCFFSTWRYSEAACFNRALQISDVIQVYFHWWCLWHLSTSWSTTRWGVGFAWSCSVGLYSSLGSTKKYRWVGMSVLNFLKKGNPDVSASMNISCHQKLPDQALQIGKRRVICFHLPTKHQIIKEGPENPIDLAMTQTNISTAGSVVKPFKPPFSSI